MIKKAVESDYKEITNLGLKYDSNFVNHFNLNNFIDEYHNIYIYHQDEKIIGFCMIEDTIDESSLVLIYVDEEYRNNHIATRLINHCFSHLKNNIKRVILEVSVNNDAAIALYKKMGFNCINTRKKYYSDGSDAMIMERIINNG